MRDTLSKIQMSRQQAHNHEKAYSFRIFTHAESVLFFSLRYFMNSCCTNLQTYVRIEIDLVFF